MHGDPSTEQTSTPIMLPAARGDLAQRWTEQHGADAARRLVAAEALADAVAEQITPPNTTRSYATGWRVWERFCASQRLPVAEGSRGALVAFVAWLLREGRQRPGPDGVLGYASAAAQLYLTAAIVGLRERGHPVSKDDSQVAREALAGLAIQLLKDGERRGRGKAPAADVDSLRRIAVSTPDTLAGLRDKSLILLTFNLAGRASEPAGLLLGDVTEHPEGLRPAIRTAKTRWSVREPAIPYAADPAVCAVVAWKAWRTALDAKGRETGTDYADPAGPAFHTIDRWGNVGGPMSPDAVTAAVTRTAERAGIRLRWTGHSLRAGLATEGRRHGKDSIAIARQGGWAPGSRSLAGYMQIADDWADNAANGLL